MKELSRKYFFLVESRTTYEHVKELSTNTYEQVKDLSTPTGFKKVKDLSNSALKIYRQDMYKSGSTAV